MNSINDVVRRILTTYDTITVVGASGNPSKAAHRVPADLQAHGWRIIPVNPRGGTILGEPAYSSLADVPGPIGLVDVFRPAPETADVARAAVAAGATALWLQLGIASRAAREIAEGAGLLYVEDRCIHAERRRLDLEAPSLRPSGDLRSAVADVSTSPTRTAGVGSLPLSGRPAEARPEFGGDA